MNRIPSIMLALTAVLMAAGFAWYIHRPESPGQATWEDVEAEAEAGGYRLISTEDLAELHRREDSNLLLVDTRQEWEYRTGYIEGAVHFSMEPTAWARWRNADELEDFLGPDKTRNLVFY